MSKEDKHTIERCVKVGAMRKSTNFCTIDSLRGIPIELICGIDEAGRGPLAGPVTAASAILPSNFPIDLLDDSKRMSSQQREVAYAAIVHGAIDWAIGWATVQEIGKLNILGASLRAMERAFAGMTHKPVLVVVDGNFAPNLWMNGASIEAATMPKADGLIASVMAASILAKVARDHFMERLDALMPEYGYASHKGYPTVKHRKALSCFGATRFHREGFQLLPQSELTLFDAAELSED